ncbi:MAG: hypothetical protein HYR80_04780 [Nitrospirae bacterium]|nr:hypothetical protein [Nitrospirota bacterium]
MFGTLCQSQRERFKRNGDVQFLKKLGIKENMAGAGAVDLLVRPGIRRIGTLERLGYVDMKKNVQLFL